jgi:hypothetical protein
MLTLRPRLSGSHIVILQTPMTPQGVTLVHAS